MTLLDLAKRCEQAKESDIYLDMDIAVEVFGGKIVWKKASHTMSIYPVRRHESIAHVGGFGNAPVDAYTSSVDAAMSLIPDNHWVQYLGQNLEGWNCIVERNGCSSVVKRASSAALALTAANLRALYALAKVDD